MPTLTIQVHFLDELKAKVREQLASLREFVLSLFKLLPSCILLIMLHQQLPSGLKNFVGGPPLEKLLLVVVICAEP